MASLALGVFPRLPPKHWQKENVAKGVKTTRSINDYTLVGGMAFSVKAVTAMIHP